MIETLLMLIGSLIPPTALTLLVQRIVMLLIGATAEEISALANVVLAFTAIIAAIVALVELRKRIDKERIEVLEKREKALSTLLREYFREYRTDEMGFDVRHLWELYRFCIDSSTDLIAKFLETREYWMIAGTRSLGDSRRAVSAFYQELAIFADNSSEVREEIYNVWDEPTLRIIPDVLLPIELDAMHRITKTEKSEVVPYPFLAMQRLYEGSKSKA